MGKHWHHPIVDFSDPGRVVHMHLCELDLIDNRLGGVPLLFGGRELGHLFDLDLPVFRDDILDVELQEAVERLDLL